MPAADLDGPLDDFRERISQIRQILAVVEAATKAPAALTSGRTGVDFAHLSLVTGNTASAMSLVLLASSFEEFVREEIGQCGLYLSERYLHLADQDRRHARNSYWSICLDKTRHLKSILTRDKSRVIDLVAVSKIKSIVDSAQGFVVADDPSFVVGDMFGHHSNNFKPHVVNEIAARIGVKDLIASASDTAKIKAHFGVTTKADAANRLKAKLESFYDRRNEIVHSLSASTGYGVDVLFDYTELFDFTADGIRASLKSHIGKW